MPQTTIVDPNLKWETTAQTNLGLDFSVLRNILTLTVDLYNKTTSDVILQRSVAMYNGRETVSGNYGKINNKGLEIMTDWHAVSSKDFSVNVGANLSINRNKVLDLGGADQIFLNENLRITSYNVCYTKLLRKICTESSAEMPVPESLTVIVTIPATKSSETFNATTPFSPVYLKAFESKLYITFSILSTRITSYNVCYTKLLRSLR